MRHAHVISIIALVGATALMGCNEQQTAQDGASAEAATNQVANQKLQLPTGTSIDVTLAHALSSETAKYGDVWTGSVQNTSVVDGRNVIPAGSSVAGTVISAKPARKGDRAMLELGLSSITIDGHSYQVRGSTEAVIAGSPRARNLGAIAGGAAAGALVGQATSHSTKGTVIGAVVGGGAATAVVSQTKGWQVVLKEGTPLTFTTNEPVAVRP